MPHVHAQKKPHILLFLKLKIIKSCLKLISSNKTIKQLTFSSIILVVAGV